jgi:hypothetical protein
MADMHIHADDSLYKKFESETARQNIIPEDAFVDAINKWLNKNDLEKEKSLNRSAYERMEKELKKKYSGKYAVIIHGELSGVCDNLKDAWKIAGTGSAKHYLVLKIGEERKIARICWSAITIKNE